ncbi:MAG: hypothetical protein ABI239_05485 [Aquihabitans sp.]
MTSTAPSPAGRSGSTIDTKVIVSGRRERIRASRLLHGSAWVLIGLAVQAVLSFSFWTLAAHVAMVDDVGRASAMFTSIQFINYSTGLGLTIALARHATGTTREDDALFGWSVTAIAGASSLGALLFLAVSTSDAVGMATASTASRLVFAFYVSGMAVGLLTDVRMMAGRRWGWLVGRIAIVGVVRLPLVLVDVGIDEGIWLYHLMMAPLAIGGYASLFLLRVIGSGRLSWKRPKLLAPFARFAGVNWLATLASTAPQFVLPLVVLEHVTSSVYAGFFLAWTMTGMVFLVPGAISQILLVEGAKSAEAEREGQEAEMVVGSGASTQERQALKFSLGVAVLAWVGSLAGAQLLSWIFGEDYDVLAHTLPALVVAGIPWAFTSVRLSEARLRRDQPATIAITLTLGLAILGPALVWVPNWGVAGATRAWIIGNVVAAIVAQIFHRRRFTSRHSKPVAVSGQRSVMLRRAFTGR